MRIKKTFAFQGTVTSAKGWWKNKVIGKPIQADITVTGNEADFSARCQKVFWLGGQVTVAPRAGCIFPGDGLAGDGYPYVLRRLKVKDVIEGSDSKIELSFTVVPWDKIEKMRFVCYLKSWWKWYFLDEVVIEGEALMCKSEQVEMITAKKRW